MGVKIEHSWKNMLIDEFEKEYFLNLTDFVKKQYQSGTVYPHPTRIFSAFDLCPFDNVKLVIIGQDPYHGPGQANGLSFSVNDNVDIPPSLRNIYKEIESDTGAKMPNNGNLERWAQQGVLLLNATLTVLANSPGSHQNKGWEDFTNAAIRKLSSERDNIVFFLWGTYAQKKGEIIDKSKHLVLTAPHPSPLSAFAGFFGCRHFSKANTYLLFHNREPIEW
ncbi:uracil-DNA glycosylase [Candidatus Microgenomates bacterium]|nr:MAG: uracil-DNA glycosylase [Candidatus Microgenomates bacterium]